MAAKKADKKISLVAVLDLNEASTLRSKLMGLRGNNVVVDASGVERVGALCVQVIMAAAKTWEEDKLSFTFSKVSDAFQKTMQLIGVNIDHLLAKEIRQ
ncbi:MULTISPECIES: STAS domain-containing protein [Rhizobium]|uniref:STAS domain-containing protein n=2 Tax=Rhizobium TaxID=379 RepID=A0AAF1KIA3_9HYPH|nr:MULTISPECIES: STAS domain-containing protein [Rhizobium]MBO9097248.1 STAS domain-containing protein [Rhizobium sp. L58/93]MBO9133900.1 STAS domain-containing protein [Rhizobium sp. B209b/85]MBO9167487.1 STAS domain-containing protein [Rhizobium sp. L245/93]MBO9183446.1 STAS domain-containing protein [Rhizobium sp. E27B/91]MBZ5760355.1 STAS domain-containing protein [Rhizobium sp. VS19-DR96]